MIRMTWIVQEPANNNIIEHQSIKGLVLENFLHLLNSTSTLV
jgi:hypothetical protein